MKLSRSWLMPLALGLLAAPGMAQGIGSNLPPVELEDISGVPAGSFDEFAGRAVLIEFFAYW